MKAYRNKIYTIDVNVKEWFDRVNGNSYFGGFVTVNYGRKTAKVISIPFQYGYGDHYRDMAFKALIKNKVIRDVKEMESYFRYYERKGIISRHNKHENCKQRDVKWYAEVD